MRRIVYTGRARIRYTGDGCCGTRREAENAQPGPEINAVLARAAKFPDDLQSRRLPRPRGFQRPLFPPPPNTTSSNTIIASCRGAGVRDCPPTARTVRLITSRRILPSGNPGRSTISGGKKKFLKNTTTAPTR